MSYPCLTMNLYSFVSNRQNFLSRYRIIALKEFWSFLTLYKVFISTLRLNRTVCLFSSYLLGRTRTTQTGPHVSSRVGISCGVLQGSVLGPLLFRLNINDIYVSSDKLNFYLFANDTNILFANKNLTSLEQIVSQELCNLRIYLAYSK